MRRKLLAFAAFLLPLLAMNLITVFVSAQTPSSSNYQVPESSFTSGADIDANSASFNAQGSIGELGVGLSDSNNYSAIAGFITPREEFLELVVQTSSVDLGILTTGTTGSGSADFYVRSYINGNYIVQTIPQSLTSEGGEVLDPLTSPAISQQGTEQFGINLVENTSAPIGADPSPAPSTLFANGEAATGYDTPDTFKYLQGDIIARSGSVGEAWGRTNFTISYIANISNITPAGLYEIDHDIVLVSTY